MPYQAKIIAINFLGHIIRIRKLEQDEYQYETRITFDVIENRDRETIIKYIFKQQRQLRNKVLYKRQKQR